MYRLVLLLVFAGCARAEYRFERIDGDRMVPLQLSFDGFSGSRDGAVVKAKGRFANGADVVTIDINVFLRPPAEFQSGTYTATVAGKTNTGVVECPSLNFQGGQTALPAVGGVFILKDEQNRPLYRVTIPATTLSNSQ